MFLGYVIFSSIDDFRIAHNEAKIFNNLPIIGRNRQSRKREILKQQTIAVAKSLPKIRGTLDETICCVIVSELWPQRLLNTFTYFTQEEVNEYFLSHIDD